jgi:hypothetical protein
MRGQGSNAVEERRRSAAKTRFGDDAGPGSFVTSSLTIGRSRAKAQVATRPASATDTITLPRTW